jgi:hypothetical protein
MSDIRDLCLLLDIEYDDLRGETRSEKVTALIYYCQSRGRLADLFAALRELRPDIELPDAQDVPPAESSRAASEANAPQTPSSASSSASPYQSVFACYSAEDIAIVERVRQSYRALGINFITDPGLRGGNDWQQEIERLIASADIFQLFWSQSAAASPLVEREWRYALKLVEDGSKPANFNFIRPVYWEQPLPPVPDELRHLHFAYEPDLAIPPKEDEGQEASDTQDVPPETFDAPRVFISYSSQDGGLGQQMARVYRTISVENLMPFHFLSAERGAGSVEERIEQADMFYLLWSSAAGASPGVEREWRYALQLIERGAKPADFIRPVYWEQQLPLIPRELSRLGFSYMPQLADVPAEPEEQPLDDDDFPPGTL